MFRNKTFYSKKVEGLTTELVEKLCNACSNDLNSEGYKLLEETANAIAFAVQKVSELEAFIESNDRNVISNKIKGLKDDAVQGDVDNVNSTIKEKNYSIYFSVAENFAESHIIDAFKLAGINNFHLDKLINRINFAYGFISFDDEGTYKRAVSSSTVVNVGKSILTIIPKTGLPSYVLDENEQSSVSPLPKRKRI